MLIFSLYCCENLIKISCTLSWKEAHYEVPGTQMYQHPCEDVDHTQGLHILHVEE